MKIYTVLVEDDDGNVSNTYCFTEVAEASKFRRHINEESNTGLKAYIACDNWLFKDGQSAIDEFIESYGE
jgi:hypothetical protein